MKGVILAGGLGKRLYPLTYSTNKHLLPVYDEPMIFYPLRTLVQAGITEAIVVVGGPFAGDFMRVLKNGKELGLTHLEYAFQAEEGGIAQALGLCEDFADGGDIAVILGDNTTDADIGPAVRSFKGGAKVLLYEVPDPGRFGVATVEGGKIVKIVEKPDKPESNLAVTGLYLYDKRVFDFIRRTKPSGRGELEITDVNNMYVETGELTWDELKGFWSDAGTPNSLFRTNLYWALKKGDKEFVEDLLRMVEKAYPSGRERG